MLAVRAGRCGSVAGARREVGLVGGAMWGWWTGAACGGPGRPAMAKGGLHDRRDDRRDGSGSGARPGKIWEWVWEMVWEKFTPRLARPEKASNNKPTRPLFFTGGSSPSASCWLDRPRSTTAPQRWSWRSVRALGGVGGHI